MFTTRALSRLINSFDNCPWGVTAGRAQQWRAAAGCSPDSERSPPTLSQLLYTAEERRRRDAIALDARAGRAGPGQFAVFLVSLVLVLRCLATGEGQAAATISVVVKTLTLYAIMITGSIWEQEVFGRYLFARRVLLGGRVQHARAGLAHRLSRRAVLGSLDTHALRCCSRWRLTRLMWSMPTQFVLKLRAARLQQRDDRASSVPPH